VSMAPPQDAFPLHWPLINSDHMRTQLAKRELEKKRIEDAHRCEITEKLLRSLAQACKLQMQHRILLRRHTRCRGSTPNGVDHAELHAGWR